MADAADNTGKIIEQAKRELQRMIDTNPDIMLLVDRAGTVLRTNRALLEALGLKDYGEAVGRQAVDLLGCEDPNIIGTLLSGTPGTHSAEGAAGMRDGAAHTLRFTAINSGPDLWVLMVRDVTEENREAVKREKSYKREAVQALAGALMHHANQALTVIMVTANLLQIELEKGKTDTGKLKKSMQTIMDNALEVSRLLQRAENPKDYVTETYMEGLDILDLERSAGDAS